MNKKTMALISIFFVLFLNTVNGDPLLELSWITPTQTITIIPHPTGIDEVDVNVNVLCNGISNCLNTTATLQYCKGTGCVDYADMNIDMNSESGDLRIVDDSTPTTQDLDEIVGGASVEVNWRINWGNDYHFKLGDENRGRLRVVGKSTSTDPLTEYLEGREIILYTIDLNSLAGDEEEPYIDVVNDQKTELKINSMLAGNMNIINGPLDWSCKYSVNEDFLPMHYCPPDIDANTNVICDIKDDSDPQEPLPEGSYTYYYKCHMQDLGGGWSDDFSETHRIDFDINFTGTVSVEILSPSQGQEFIIGDEIDFRSQVIHNGFPFTVEWTSSKDTGWKRTDENFVSDELSIGNHTITLTGFFQYGPIEDFEMIEISDSVNITISPIPVDVLNIIAFEITNQTNPGKKITTQDTIEIKATIYNETDKDECSLPELTIVEAETGETVYYEIDGKGPVCFGGVVPANDSLQKDYNVNLSSEGITEGNYKVKFDVAEINKEQNKENNYATKIITVLEPEREVKLSGLSVYIIPLLLIAVLIIINKKKIRSALKKTKKN